MSNLLLGYANYIETATLSGGSWNASYPLTNLQNRLLSKKARSTNASNASTLINIDLGSAKSVQAFGAIASSISASGATYRLRGSSSATMSPALYDSGTLSANTQTPNLIVGMSDAVSARYWRLEIFDASNANGYVQIGRLFIGPALAPGDNYSKGSEIGYVSRSGIVESIGGVEYFNKKPNRRRFRFQLDWLTEAEAFNQALELQRLSDITEEVLLIRDPADTTTNQKRHFLGRLAQLDAIANPYLTLHQAAFEVLEIV